GPAMSHATEMVAKELERRVTVDGETATAIGNFYLGPARRSLSQSARELGARLAKDADRRAGYFLAGRVLDCFWTPGALCGNRCGHRDTSAIMKKRLRSEHGDPVCDECAAKVAPGLFQCAVRNR